MSGWRQSSEHVYKPAHPVNASEFSHNVELPPVKISTGSPPPPYYRQSGGDRHSGGDLTAVLYESKLRRHKRWMCAAVCFIVLLVMATVAMATYVITRDFIPVRDEIKTMKSQMEHEMTDSKWGNYTAKLAHYDREVLALRNLIKAQADKDQEQNKKYGEVHSQLSAKIDKVQNQLDVHLKNIANNTATIDKNIKKLSVMEANFGKKMHNVTLESNDLEKRVAHLKAEVDRLSHTTTPTSNGANRLASIQLSCFFALTLGMFVYT